MIKRIFFAALIATIPSTIFAEPLADGMSAYTKGDYLQAYGHLLPLANQGNAEALYYLSRLYKSGKGVPLDWATAKKLLGKSAERGFAPAQYELANMYESPKEAGYGYLSQTDYAEAAKWYRKAAEQGIAGAYIRLGNMYDSGRGMPRNYAEALKWLLVPAGHGDTTAMLMLGERYEIGELFEDETGQSLEKDLRQAYMWYNIAAALGSKVALQKRQKLADTMLYGQLEAAQKMAREWYELHSQNWVAKQQK